MLVIMWRGGFLLSFLCWYSVVVNCLLLKTISRVFDTLEFYHKNGLPWFVPAALIPCMYNLSLMTIFRNEHFHRPSSKKYQWRRCRHDLLIPLLIYTWPVYSRQCWRMVYQTRQGQAVYSCQIALCPLTCFTSLLAEQCGQFTAIIGQSAYAPFCYMWAQRTVLCTLACRYMLVFYAFGIFLLSGMCLYQDFLTACIWSFEMALCCPRGGGEADE